MRETKEKKLIPAKTVVKALIKGFVSYGIIIGFLLLVIALTLFTSISSISGENQKILSITIPLFFAFVLYFAVHSICKISTIDLFKGCKTNSENVSAISQKMNLFFLICIILLVILSNCLLVLKLYNTRKSIDVVSETYNQVFSDNFTQFLTNKMLAEFNESKNQTLVSTVIIELSLVVSFFSLIPYQKKLILEYNDVGKRVKKEEN